MSITGDYSQLFNLNSFEDKLSEFEQDEIMTAENIGNYIQDSETDFTSLDIDSTSAEDELSEILSDSDEVSDDSEINNLKAEIESLKGKIKDYDTKLGNLNSKLDKLTSQLEKEKAKYDEISQTIKNQNNKLKQTVSSINNAKKAIEHDTINQQKSATKKAASEYNPEKDGNWDKYLKNCLSNVEIDASLKTILSSLLKKSDSLQGNLESLKASLSETANTINNLNSQISSTKAEIAYTSKLKDNANKELTVLNSELENKVQTKDSNETTTTGSSETSTTTTIPENVVKVLDEKLGNGFCAKVEEISAKLKCSPIDMLAIMSSESGLDPKAYNSYGGATGLIQFMPQTAAELGTSTAELAQMSAIEQLDYVEKFYSHWIDTIMPDAEKITAGELYALTFLPAYANNEELCSAGSEYYNVNSALDVDQNGTITKTDLRNRAYNQYVQLMSSYGVETSV